MRQENHVELLVISERFTPSELEERIGMACDRCWRIGDRRGKSTIVEKTHGWVLRSPLPLTDELEAHLRSLLQRIAPRAAAVREVSRSETVLVSCAIYYHGSQPALYIKHGDLEHVTQLGADIDFDLYHLEPDDEEGLDEPEAECPNPKETNQ